MTEAPAAEKIEMPPYDPVNAAEYVAARNEAVKRGALEFWTTPPFRVGLGTGEAPPVGNGVENIYEWTSYSDDMQGAGDSERGVTTHVALMARFSQAE